MTHYYQTLTGENWFNYEDFYSFVIDNLPTESKMVEIGSWLGRSISYFAVESKIKSKNIMCYCVDIWRPYDEIPKHDLFDNDNLYNQFLLNTDRVKDVVIPFRGNSQEMSYKFNDNFFDFIFIDAAHDYQNVYDDIKLWLPKLKKNRIIGGHDYYTGNDVYKAVNDFFGKENVKVNGPCWYVLIH
jgi:hypothetical protein